MYGRLICGSQGCCQSANLQGAVLCLDLPHLQPLFGLSRYKGSGRGGGGKDGDAGDRGGGRSVSRWSPQMCLA